MLFCKDNDSIGVGTSALSNVASMFFRSLWNYSNSSSSNSSSTNSIEKIDLNHPTTTTNTNTISIDDDDDNGILYCMPIVTTDKVKRKRKGKSTKAIKAQRKDVKKKK